jgi:dihydropteroate synthase
LVEDGADIIDVGGESTRPGYSPVSAQEEAHRVIPAITEIRRALQIPISVDTQKSDVAERAIAAGAGIINDVSGLTDPKMAPLAARHNCTLVLTHNRSLNSERTAMSQVIEILSSLVDRAESAGVASDQIIVDPGLGFNKSWEQNFEIMGALSRLTSLGKQVLVGPSRKGMIGKVLGTPPTDRLEGTIALCVLCIASGATMLRVHEVRQVSRAVRVTSALMSAHDGRQDKMLRT